MEVSEFKNVVWDYTRKIAESMNCIFSPVSENYGLTMMQTRILMELHQNGAHTIGSLASSTCVAGANISAMCKRLENQGLLERARNREDERVVRVMLTELGKETVTEIDRSCNDKILQHLVNEKEETFEDIILGLQKLNELLQSINCIEKD
ncbi:MAG TPA: MarR family transcriptional regulator [Clostridia bacterium]|nr:MarR family transcriptional regulator [Clostridia bacterium]